VFWQNRQSFNPYVLTALRGAKDSLILFSSNLGANNSFCPHSIWHIRKRVWKWFFFFLVWPWSGRYAGTLPLWLLSFILIVQSLQPSTPRLHHTSVNNSIKISFLGESFVDDTSLGCTRLHALYPRGPYSNTRWRNCQSGVHYHCTQTSTTCPGVGTSIV